MKIRILIISILIAGSCQKENTNYLLGSWKMKDAASNSSKYKSDKSKFLKNGSATFELFSDGEYEKIMCEYSLDEETKTLKITIDKRLIATYRILKLDAEELDLENLKTHRIIRNIRCNK